MARDFVHYTQQRYLSCVDGDTFLGGCMLGRHLDGIWVYMLFVPQEHRRKGVATAIIKDLQELVQPLYLKPEPFDPSIISLEDLILFYKKLGFVDYSSDGTLRYKKNQ